MRRSGRTYQLLRRGHNVGVQRLKRLARPNASAFVSGRARVSADVALGDFAFVGPDCTIPPGVTIGAYSMLAAEVAIVGDDHDWRIVGTPMQFTGRPPQRGTSIGADVWLGRRVVLMRGLNVGDGAIVAAGSVVTKDVPEGEVWAGVPAARLRDRFDSPQELSRHLALVRAGGVEAAFADPLKDAP